MKPENRYPRDRIFFAILIILATVGCPASAKRRASSTYALKDKGWILIKHPFFL